MDPKRIAPDLSVSPQIDESDVGDAASKGFRSIIINRPDGEADDQTPSSAIMAAAERHGLEVRFLPVTPGQITDADVTAFAAALDELPGPSLAYCGTGKRSATLWALSQAPHLSTDAILAAVGEAGYDLSAMRERLEKRAETPRPDPSGPDSSHAEAARRDKPTPHHTVVIVGGGAGGIAAAASLLKRRPGLDIAIVEPKESHDYQPGWTLVGGGVFGRDETRRPMSTVMPEGATWIRTACAGFAPEENEILLEDGSRLGYEMLIAAPGLKLDWGAVKGLEETLGRNGVTSNYRFDLAPYTWELTSTLDKGKALFTQPPMPIKCAGAPQKAMYLSCDEWRRRGVLADIDVSFHNAGGVLFGVPEYVPALMSYVERYGITLDFNENLIAVDGDAQQATFRVTKDGKTEEVTRDFDMLHVCPPQTSHDLVKTSPLANEAGWIDVDERTLQHKAYGNVFALGDGGSTPNAKTAAAVRKQAPVAAVNVLAALDGKAPNAVYDGYGSCPLTVERGKIVLAEFGYGGKLLPSFPAWLIDGTKPTRAAWFLKEKMLPAIYFEAMLKGYEWLAAPRTEAHPAAHRAKDTGGDESSRSKAA